jgi:ABC-type methionine transport system ATPase subunit
MYSKTISLRFPTTVVDEPIAATLVKKFDLSFNILKAVIYPRKEGLMVLQLSGHQKNYKKGIQVSQEYRRQSGEHRRRYQTKRR